jgi:hypothetical protein
VSCFLLLPDHSNEKPEGMEFLKSSLFLFLMMRSICSLALVVGAHGSSDLVDNFVPCAPMEPHPQCCGCTLRVDPLNLIEPKNNVPSLTPQCSRRHTTGSSSDAKMTNGEPLVGEHQAEGSVPALAAFARGDGQALPWRQGRHVCPSPRHASYQSETGSPVDGTTMCSLPPPPPGSWCAYRWKTCSWCCTCDLRGAEVW